MTGYEGGQAFTVPDPAAPDVPRPFDDLRRRAQDLDALINSGLPYELGRPVLDMVH